jgi:tetratricopeptide (TPR) repeat protein
MAWPLPNLEADYRARGKDALSGQDFARLHVAAQRLVQFNLYNPEAHFWLALVADSVGDQTTANAILTQWAPPTGGGFPPAHFWLAERLLRTDPLTPQALSLAEKHLLAVGNEAELAAAVDRRLAQVMIKTGRLVDAEKYLQRITLASFPDLRVIHAEALMAKEKPVEARRELGLAIDDAKRMITQGDETGYARRTLADAYILQRNYPEAERLLRELTAIKENETNSLALAQLYSKWINEANSGSVPTGPNLPMVEHAIERLSHIEKKGVAVSGMLVYLLQYAGRLDEAQRLLERLAENNVDASFDLARLYLQRGRYDEARKRARQTAERLTALINAQPHSFPLRERTAAAWLISEEYAKAIAVLESGYSKSKEKAYLPLLASSYASWWDAVAAGKVEAPADRMAYLRKAIQYDPWNAAVIQRLSSMQGPDTEAARRLLSDILSRGESPPAAVHWILGNEAWNRGEHVMARSHMEQAYALSKTNPLILNNLAWYLAFSEPRDLNRALMLANEAVNRAPVAVEVHDTRGRIRAQLGDWQGALADLQICLPYKKGDPEFHRLIATAFAQQNMADLADHHRRLAAEAEALKQKHKQNTKQGQIPK